MTLSNDIYINNARSEKIRIEWIDGAKGIGILLMVIGHAGAPDFLRHWIYGFHMPMFFIIAGFVYNKKNGRKEDLSNF